jgi:hypothetical protein
LLDDVSARAVEHRADELAHLQADQHLLSGRLTPPGADAEALINETRLSRTAFSRRGVNSGIRSTSDWKGRVRHLRTEDGKRADGIAELQRSLGGEPTGRGSGRPQGLNKRTVTVVVIGSIAGVTAAGEGVAELWALLHEHRSEPKPSPSPTPCGPPGSMAQCISP